MYIYIYIYMCMCIYTYKLPLYSTCLYTYIYMCICMYVCVCVLYVHINIQYYTYYRPINLLSIRSVVVFTRRHSRHRRFLGARLWFPPFGSSNSPHLAEISPEMAQKTTRRTGGW